MNISTGDLMENESAVTIEKIVLVPHHKSLEWSKHQASLSGLDVIDTLPNLHALVIRMKKDDVIKEIEDNMELPLTESPEWKNVFAGSKVEFLS